MKRVAFKMKLHPNSREEYKRRHDAIWPELAELLRNNGISDYSIFLDEETDTLFAVQMTEDGASSQDLSANPVVQRWWNYMADIMQTNPDKSPVTIPLTEVFYLK